MCLARLCLVKVWLARVHWLVKVWLARVHWLVKVWLARVHWNTLKKFAFSIASLLCSMCPSVSLHIV
jgi:hypothetical protein